MDTMKESLPNPIFFGLGSALNVDPVIKTTRKGPKKGDRKREAGGRKKQKAVKSFVFSTTF